MLRVLETGQEFCVVYVHDSQDWVAKFDKSWPEARHWAEHMADTYNHRLRNELKQQILRTEVKAMNQGETGMLLDTQGKVEMYLRDNAWLPSSRSMVVEALSGGVSSRVWRIECGQERWVLKQALSKLNVQADWYSDVNRIVQEQAAMQLLYGILPVGTVPEVLYADPENSAYIMTCAPVDADTWKNRLMGGLFETDTASSAGHLLREMHIHSRHLTESQKEKFRNLRYFEELRIDPFHRSLIQRYPQLEAAIDRLIRDLTNVEPELACLVHGDFSPKNMLVHSVTQVILIDYEVAHWGHPVFDLAFCTAHLMLKGWGLKRKMEAVALIESFYKAYGACDPELLPHLGLMLLARMDGKSPVDYISDDAVKEEIRTLAVYWIREGLELEPMQAISSVFERGRIY